MKNPDYPQRWYLLSALLKIPVSDLAKRLTPQELKGWFRILATFLIFFLCGAGSASPPADVILPSVDYVERGDYLVSYNQTTRCPKWVMETLTAKNQLHAVTRTDQTFKKDPELSPVTIKDYSGSGFDIGHLAPAADHCTSEKDLLSTFTFANAMPQYPACNRGIWKGLENHIRSLANSPSILYVVTAPVWESVRHQASVQTIGVNNVWVPTHCAKCVEIVNGDSKSFQAWVIPNIKAEQDDYNQFATTVQNFNALTGLHAFTAQTKDLDEEVVTHTPAARSRTQHCDPTRCPFCSHSGTIWDEGGFQCPACGWSGTIKDCWVTDQESMDATVSTISADIGLSTISTQIGNTPVPTDSSIRADAEREHDRDSSPTRFPQEKK